MGKLKRISGVYAITCVFNKKVYVGHSMSIKKRWALHRNKLRRNIHTTPHLQAAWNKYGENMFTFSILEVLPDRLDKKEYEIVETKWVLFFKSHLSEFGYNSVLPGTIHLYREDENITALNKKISTTIYICINIISKEVIECMGPREVNILTNITLNHIGELSSYWKSIDIHRIGHATGIKKSSKGWLIVRKDNYDPEFDYINFKKHKPSSSIKKTWRDYYKKEEHRKDPKDIIPREQRNLKRVSIIAVNVITGEEREYRMLKDCYEEFDKMKIYKCLNNPFGKYKHKGHYFKRK